MGFVEALIAIMVVGASAVVLMQIATRTMKDMIQNETIDNMTQYAIEAAEMAQDIASNEVQSGEDLFPNEGGRCYVIIKNEDNTYAFRKNGEEYQSYLEDERSSYKVGATLPINDKFFRVFCLDESYAIGDKYVISKVIVGQVASEGRITKGNFVKDYSYFTVINL